MSYISPEDQDKIIEDAFENGYLNKLTIKSAQINPKPKSAPALVDCTKCDTPIAAPANNNPGPKVLKIWKLGVFIEKCYLISSTNIIIY